MKYLLALLIFFSSPFVMEAVRADDGEDKTYEQMLLLTDYRGFKAYGTITFKKSSEAPKIIAEINKELKAEFREAMTSYIEAHKEYKAWLSAQKEAQKAAKKEWEAANPDAGRSGYKKYFEEQLFAAEYQKWADAQGEKLPAKEKNAHKNFLKWVKKNPARHYEAGVPFRPRNPQVKPQGSRVKKPSGDKSSSKYDKFIENVAKRSERAEKDNERLAKHLGLEGVEHNLEHLFSIGAPE